MRCVEPYLCWGDGAVLVVVCGWCLNCRPLIEERTHLVTVLSSSEPPNDPGALGTEVTDFLKRILQR